VPLYLRIVSPSCVPVVNRCMRTRRSRRGHARLRWSARRQHRFGCPLRMSITSSSIIVGRYGVLDIHTGRSGGEPMREKMVSCVVLHANTRGTRGVSGACLAVGGRIIRTISRMVGVLEGVRVGMGWRCRDVLSRRRGEVRWSERRRTRSCSGGVKMGKGGCLAEAEASGNLWVSDAASAPWPSGPLEAQGSIPSFFGCASDHHYLQWLPP